VEPDTGGRRALRGEATKLNIQDSFLILILVPEQETYSNCSRQRKGKLHHLGLKMNLSL